MITINILQDTDNGPFEFKGVEVAECAVLVSVTFQDREVFGTPILCHKGDDLEAQFNSIRMYCENDLGMVEVSEELPPEVLEEISE